MNHVTSIHEQARLAQALAAERRTLFEQVPFARELDRSRYDLERISRPVVAVAGVVCVGKSALIQSLSAVPALPWRWLEVEITQPGDGPEAQEAWSPLPVAELAEHCLLVTSAIQPPSQEDLIQLQQIAEVFPEDTLEVVLTRCDQLPAGESASAIRDQVHKLLQEALPHRTLQVFVVSSRSAEGLDTLREELSAALCRRQREQLEEALKDWGTLLTDLRALLEMRELARLKPETLERLRSRLDLLLMEESRRLGSDLPVLTQEVLRELEPKLPDAQRRLVAAFRERLSTRVESRLSELHRRLNQELATELLRDMEVKTTLELTNRFDHLLEPRSIFFDWQSARTGGLVSAAGAALLMGARKSGGWALAGAALLGGLLGGLLGKASIIRNAEELQQRVAAPLLQDSEQHLEQATEASRADLARLCDLLQKVAEVFSPEKGACDPAWLEQLATQAEARHQQLSRELKELRWKFELDRLQTQVSARPEPHQVPPATEPGAKALPTST